MLFSIYRDRDSLAAKARDVVTVLAEAGRKA